MPHFENEVASKWTLATWLLVWQSCFAFILFINVCSSFSCLHSNNAVDPNFIADGRPVVGWWLTLNNSAVAKHGNSWQVDRSSSVDFPSQAASNAVQQFSCNNELACSNSGLPTIDWKHNIFADVGRTARNSYNRCNRIYRQRLVIITRLIFSLALKYRLNWTLRARLACAKPSCSISVVDTGECDLLQVSRAVRQRSINGFYRLADHTCDEMPAWQQTHRDSSPGVLIRSSDHFIYYSSNPQPQNQWAFCKCTPKKQ